MYSSYNNDTLASLVRMNPELEAIISSIQSDNKKATSMLVHELRNPLSLLKGTVQYIELKHPEAKEYKYWDQLHDLIRDMEQITADASMLNNYNYINKEETSLVQLVENLTSNFMPQAYTREIDLTFTADPAGKDHYKSYSCDAGKLKQALTNLIKNAFEATTPGNYIQVSLGYIAGDELAPSKLSISISNNGQSIPVDILDNIFTPFVTYKKGGTGVGLALVKKVVDMHYGSISVESNEEKTAFTIFLPL